MSTPIYRGNALRFVPLAPDWIREPKLSVTEGTMICEALNQSEERWQQLPRPMYGISYEGIAVDSKQQGTLRKLFESAEAAPLGVALWSEESSLLHDTEAGTDYLNVTTLSGTWGALDHVLIWLDWENWEVLEISNVAFNDTVGLAELTTRVWPAGTRVAPVAWGYCKRPDFSALDAIDSSIEIEFEERFIFGITLRREYPLLSPTSVSVGYSACKDEITLAWGSIPSMQNVQIYHGPDPSGPWTFWGETRQNVSGITLSNYFAGKWVKVIGQRTEGIILLRTFQASTPNVLPPSFTAQKHHFETADYSAADLSTWPLVYSAVSALDPARVTAGVFPGNLVDPSSGDIAYVVPLFSSAFVEVGPRYYQQLKPAGADNNMGIKVTLSSSQGGVAFRITTDGTDPTLTNGFTDFADVQPFQDTPKPRSIAICRAFKDGCKSPPLYILLDWGRIASAQITSNLHEGAYTATMWCGRFAHQLISTDPDTCMIVETGSQPGASSQQISPCDPPSSPTLLDSAIANSCGSATVNMEDWSGGSLLLQNITSTEAMNFNTSSHYDGNDPMTCPSAPWGGGQWRCGVSTSFLASFNYSWQSLYSALPSGDLYLIDAAATVNGAPAIFPSQAPREFISALTGASGGSTNDLAASLFLSIPASVKLCPGSGQSARLTEANVTQSCCNS